MTSGKDMTKEENEGLMAPMDTGDEKKDLEADVKAARPGHKVRTW